MPGALGFVPRVRLKPKLRVCAQCNTLHPCADKDLVPYDGYAPLVCYQKSACGASVGRVNERTNESVFPSLVTQSYLLMSHASKDDEDEKIKDEREKEKEEQQYEQNKAEEKKEEQEQRQQQQQQEQRKEEDEREPYERRMWRHSILLIRDNDPT